MRKIIAPLACVALASFSLAACAPAPERDGEHAVAGRGAAGLAPRSCAEMPRVSAHDFATILDTAYFESGYASGVRSSECAKIAMTIYGRAAVGGYEYGGVGQSAFDRVVSATYQFEVWPVRRLRDGSGRTYSLIDGVSVADVPPADAAFQSPQQIAVCEAAVRQALSSTPSVAYLNFHAAGDGTNTFSSAVSMPAGCNVLGGASAPAPAPSSNGMGRCSCDGYGVGWQPVHSDVCGEDVCGGDHEVWSCGEGGYFKKGGAC